LQDKYQPEIQSVQTRRSNKKKLILMKTRKNVFKYARQRV